MSAGDRATGQQRALLERALQEIRELRARVESYERSIAEPIAVLGAGCRFPGGASTPDGYWDLLRRGVDAVTEIPADRWDAGALYDPDPDAPGKVATRFGAFLTDVDRFDAPFFQISPREAASMDPRQRLLLEVAWEALEDGGQVASRLAGSRTGVFVGLFNDDYAQLHQRLDDPAQITAYSGTGSSHSVAAGRISYCFDFRGPSIVLDTACSSSLAAIAAAGRSLRSRECDLALAGGANLILSPLFSMVASRMRMMASDGRCKAFDAQADGFVRSEGCAVVVLKRLSDALADGDPIRAVLRGWAINQDGRSNGLTAGNGLAQEDVIRRALEDARLRAADVTYVEAHGTGTPLGDPIEVEALAATYGAASERSGVCQIGSVKANLGHLEAAAGVAGFLKAVLAVQYGQIPGQLHYKGWNPHIRLDGAPLAVPVTLRDWTPTGGRFAGVSAFGWSGTNVHAVLGEAPPRPAPSSDGDRLCLLPFSAQSAAGGGRLAGAYATLLDETDAGWNDVCYTASVRREHHAYRGFVVAGSKRAAADALRDAEGQTLPLRPETPPKLVFVFPGQGSQWLGMGRQLYGEDDAFRRALDGCAAALRPLVDWSPIDVLMGRDDDATLDRIDVVQPVLFSIQVALAAMWRAWGITPDAVVGHSMGEVAAAHVAGALTLEDAALIICRRSRLLRRVSGQGAMVMVELSHEEAQGLVEDRRQRIAVGATNSPRSTVLSGDRAALDEVVAGLAAGKVFHRWIKVDVASHSPQVDVLGDDLRKALGGVRPRPARVPLWSTVTNGILAGTELTAAYWYENLRRPVLFWPVIAQLAGTGATVLELSPHPVLVPAVEDGQRHLGGGGAAVASLYRGEDERAGMLRALGRLYQRGHAVDWTPQFPRGGRCVTLPAYPWALERHWLESRPPVAPPPPAADDGAPCLYEVAWRPTLPAPAGSAAGEGAAGGRAERPAWVLYADGGGLAARLERALTARGHACTTVDAAAPPGGAPDAGPAARRGIVYLAGLDAALPALPALPGLLANLAGAIRQADGGLTRLLLITRGAQAVAGGIAPAGLAQTPLLGFARVIRSELPEVDGRCVDLDPGQTDDAAVSTILRELDLADGEEQVAWRGDVRYRARLATVPGAALAAPDGAGQLVAFRADATYLIVGGLGGVGMTLLRWMVVRGGRHFVLTGRRRPPAEVEAVLDELRRNGAEIVVESADAADAGAMRALLARIAAGMPALKGVFHAAVVLEDGMLERVEAAALGRVFAPKVDGALNLHHLTADLDLDLFVLFSSAASLIGTAGQAAYAAANAFLDGLAHYRQARGLPCLSVNWGPFAEVGQATRDAKRGRRLADAGLASLAPPEAMGLLGRLLGRRSGQVGVLHFDYDRWRDAYPRAARSPFFAEVGHSPSATTVAARPAAEPSVRDELLAADADWRRRELLEGHLCRRLAAVLRIKADVVDRQTPFRQLGVDSLLALELRNRVEAMLGLTLPSTLLWAYPTVADLAGHLARRLDTESPAGIAVASRSTVVPAVDELAAAAPVRAGSLATMLAEIDGLAEDETRRMLRHDA